MADPGDTLAPGTVEGGPADASAGPPSEPEARVVRSAGHCLVCDRIVERTGDGSCPAGHPVAAVQGRIELANGKPVPQLPRFNLAAFLIPPVWGPAHGQWAGVIFLPLWLFADSIIASGSAGVAGTALAISGTLASQAFFARRGNGVGWRRVAHRLSVEEYVRRERTWALVAVPAAVAMLGWSTYFHLVLER